MAFCPKCGSELEREDQKFCNNCGAQLTGTGASTDTPSSKQSDNYGGFSMKWYKFLIYFALWAGGIINIIMGINYLSGGIYAATSDAQVTAEMVYSAFGGLKAVDVVYGLVVVALGALQIYTRFRLAKFKTNGPKLLYICYAAGGVASLIYSIAVGSITGTGLDSSAIGSLVLNVVLFVLNYIYFNKRKSLFVND